MRRGDVVTMSGCRVSVETREFRGQMSYKADKGTRFVLVFLGILPEEIEPDAFRRFVSRALYECGYDPAAEAAQEVDAEIMEERRQRVWGGALTVSEPEEALAAPPA
jgi:hypothetical protein